MTLRLGVGDSQTLKIWALPGQGVWPGGTFPWLQGGSAQEGGKGGRGSESQFG